LANFFFLNSSCFSNVQLKGKKFQQKIVAQKIIPKKCLKLNEVMKGGLLKDLPTFCVWKIWASFPPVHIF
jgi:hypothetical protein